MCNHHAAITWICGGCTCNLKSFWIDLICCYLNKTQQIEFSVLACLVEALFLEIIHRHTERPMSYLINQAYCFARQLHSPFWHCNMVPRPWNLSVKEGAKSLNFKWWHIWMSFILPAQLFQPVSNTSLLLVFLNNLLQDSWFPV